MDATVLLLLASHLAVLGVGMAVGRWICLRSFEIIEHDGHYAVEIRHHDDDGSPA